MVPVARVRRAHGVRGELRVEALGDAPDVLRTLQEVTLRSPEGQERRWDVEVVRPGPGGSLLLRLKGLDDRTEAETLKGWDVQAPEDALPDLEEGEYWYFQLEGLRVVRRDGEVLGEVVGVFNAGASDVATVRREGGEWMLPIVDEVIVEIDAAGGRLVVDLLPGLLEGGV